MIYLVPTNESSPFHCANPISFFWRNLIEQKLRLPPLINVFHKLTHIIVYKCVYTCCLQVSGQATTRCNAQHVNTLVYIESEICRLSDKPTKALILH